MNEITQNESVIHGNGHGDAHLWFRAQSPSKDDHLGRYSSYTCRKCYIRFNHMYNYIPNTFKAMEACNVPLECKRSHKNTGYKHQITGNRRIAAYD